jgi:uncharacterized membrane protein YeaQ/YmgE (transglycosylase-associated protein family)
MEAVLSVLSWILTGLVIGLIARAIVPGRQSLGFLLTVILGVIGAFVGGLISTAIWGPPDPAANPEWSRMWPGWLMSIVGAVIVLWGYVALAGRRDTPMQPSLR